MKRTFRLLLAPVLFLAMLLAVAPQESQARWGRWGGRWGGYRGHYVARYHAPYHYGYRVYRPYVRTYHYAPYVYWGPRHTGYYHYGW